MINLSFAAIPVLFAFLVTLNSTFSDTDSSPVSLISNTMHAFHENKEDAIVGKWITVEKNVAVQVYKLNNNYRAKIIWFKIQDTTRPMNTRTDEKNPNPALRNRKWLGMEVLHGLKYNASDDEWQDGIIYDAKHGREWDAVAWIGPDGLLKVKGYWVFKFISETLTFKRVQEE